MSNTEREAERLPECMSKVEEGDGGVRGRLRTFQAKKWVKQVSLESGANAVTSGALTFTCVLAAGSIPVSYCVTIKHTHD